MFLTILNDISYVYQSTADTDETIIIDNQYFRSFQNCTQSFIYNSKDYISLSQTSFTMLNDINGKVSQYDAENNIPIDVLTS